jgi:hypothetical protein
MKRRHALVVVAALLLLCAAATAHAAMTSISFDVRTAARADRDPLWQGVSFWIAVTSSTQVNPPDYVSTVVVKAPNGDTFPLTVRDHWIPYMKAFSAQFLPSAFTGGKIPTGQYTVTVTDTSAVKITATDDLPSATFLATPTITVPLDGDSIVTEQLDIKWTAPGTQRCEIGLWNDSWNMPVILNYPDPTKSNEKMMTPTMQRHYKLLKGMLQPNRNYRVQISCEESIHDFTKQSFSKWVSFNTNGMP